ncbi:MAG: hypothetical protein JSW52_08200 [Candidatus Coatesbacteria bacterium]|nr:MAG: hypothetical protein JSW52_08200 [Candidatus Coatesbacteria bacterium]
MAPPKHRYLCYVGSFLFPFFGLVFGVVAQTNAEADYRRSGKICIWLAIVALVLVCAGSLIWAGLFLWGGAGEFFG